MFGVISVKKIIPISMICLLLDQISKLLIINNLISNETYTVINNFFNITLVHNDGAAWSILSGNRLLLIFISFIALFIIYFLFIKNKKLTKLEIIIYGMLIGGIIGNLIDRILYGYVIDFFDFKIFNYNYPVFNVADCCIVIAAILLIIDVVKEGITCKQ